MNIAIKSAGLIGCPAGWSSTVQATEKQLKTERILSVENEKIVCIIP